MIKIKKNLLAMLLSTGLIATAFANEPATLMDVFQQALANDPTWLGTTAQNLSDQQGVPISLAALLPALSLSTTGPYISRTVASGSAVVTSGSAVTVGSGTTRGYTINLNLNQTLFDLGQFAELAAQRALSRTSNARLNAAAEDLIIRVSKAYFQILSDEDNLTYLRAARRAYSEQLDQVRQQYRVGLKTITDVYTAQASYDSADADYIGAQNALANDRENLRAITNRFYPSLARLRDDFPLVTPSPASIDQWVDTAGRQNWNIRAAQYTAAAKKELIRKQFAGHLPSFSVSAGWENQYFDSSSSHGLDAGSNRIQTTSASLNMTLPLVEGGAVMAQTQRAQHDYSVAVQQLELQLRTTLVQTRQNYLNVVSGISKIRADKGAIRSGVSSLKGMRAGYHVGTETLVNVLNQQEKLLEAETQYTVDRFAYINSLLALKQAAGTLGIKDIEDISHWLADSKKVHGKKTLEARHIHH